MRKGTTAMVHGVGMRRTAPMGRSGGRMAVEVWRRWAKRAKAWSSLGSIWLMVEAEKLYPTASFRGHPRRYADTQGARIS